MVDARAGPGSSKIQTKYKSERMSSRTHQSSSNNSATASPSSASNGMSTSSNGGSPNSSSLANGHTISYLPEKFSKIFKKSKKFKDSTMSSSLSSSSSMNKRKSSSHGWSSNNGGLLSLPTTPDSLDSDYEDSRLHGSLSGGAIGGTVVQFQTQTRASAFKAQAALEARRRSLKLGSKRRKSLQPRKNRRSLIGEETLNFYDEEEWREQKSCCGMVYECPALGGAILLDVANYKPCEKHQNPTVTTQESETSTITSQTNLPLPSANETKENMIPNIVGATTKSLTHSIPTVVQLHPPAPPPETSIHVTNSIAASSSTSSCSSMSHTTSVTSLTESSSSALTITKSTPVLKKHHLFFKRQSECFPQGDMVITQNGGETSNTTTNYYNSNSVSTIKTESDYNNRIQQQQQQHQQHQYLHQQSTTTLFQRHNELHAIPLTAASPSSALSISVTSTAASVTTPSVLSSSLASASLFTPAIPQMPKHSLAKVTTISPPLSSIQTTTNNTGMPPHHQSMKTHSNFLHKIKSDTGKIVKHSLEKFNTAVRLKSSDLNDMKPVIKTVDKSYILAKPPTTGNIQSFNAATIPLTTTYQSLASYNSMAQPPLTTASLSAASPTSSTSSTSSTKFSDNSSDSGFDENMLLDRKSASPLVSVSKKNFT